MKVLSYGSLNIDYVYKVNHMVMAGETISSEEMHVFPGGKGLNQSIAFARAGLEVYHAGKVGDDSDILMETCRDNKVHTDYIEVEEGKSGHTIIQVDENGQNCILLYGGSNQKQTREQMDRVLADFSEGDLLILQNEINELPYLIEKAYEKKLSIVLNPSPYDAKLNDCRMEHVSYLFLNEVEGEQMTGHKDADRILEAIHEKFPQVKIILTLGENGSVYMDSQTKVRVPCKKTKVVDTTAAGDTFTGYFMAGITMGKSAQEALELGAAASAITVSRSGAASSIPWMKEVCAKE